jgi:tripeptide aminopeptidase
MTNWVDSQRLAETFMGLVRVDSISREEAEVGRLLTRHLTELGAEVTIDNAGEQVGGTMGNLIARINGSLDIAPMLLSAHMDTVEPGRGIVPQEEGGIISSAGDTILGADDKSAIAVILELLHCLKANGLPHGPIEVVFTICEEIGLLGARHLDYGMINAKSGYVLDTSNHRAIVTRAPAANQLKFNVHGKAAHAGGAPEKGINAIQLAAKAIANLEIGRIDAETTSNIGIIQGGLATNIVPASVVVEGEVRSHDMAKLDEVTNAMVTAFEKAVSGDGREDDVQLPGLDCDVRREFDLLSVEETHPTVKAARKAAATLNFELESMASGGGSDANIFAQHGIITPVLGTGMQNVHTVDESIAIEDMAHSVRLLLEIVSQHGMGVH